jgi:glutaredoxin
MLFSRTWKYQNDSDRPSFLAENALTHAISQLKSLDLQVFSATWCPDCRRLERWLADQAIPHTTVDIEAVPGAAERLEAETGKRAIPYILVNGRTWVRGYHRERPQRLDPGMLVEELLAAADI